MQTFHSESRTYWFNHWFTSHGALDEADTQQAMTDFRLLGVVLGLAIYNTVLLDFPLPIALYRKICKHAVGLMDLELFQPTVGKCAARISYDRWLDCDIIDTSRLFVCVCLLCRVFSALSSVGLQTRVLAERSCMMVISARAGLA